MSLKMVTKKHSFADKWDEFENNGIKNLVKFLSGDIHDSDKIQEVKGSQVFTNKEFMRLYKLIYDLCVIPKGNFSKTLYTKYVEATSGYLLNNVLPDLADSTGETLLKKLANHWDKHMNIFVKWLGKCFRYLDQHYVKQYSLETVSMKGETLFRSNVFLAVKVNVLNAIIKEFEKERDGMCIDDFSLKRVIQMIIKFRETQTDDCDFYKELEDQFIRDTSRYYNFKGEEYIKNYSCAEYLQKVESVIEEEKERTEKYLKQSSFDKYIAVVQDELLVKNMNELLHKNTGLEYILTNHLVKDIRLLYQLYCPLQEWLRDIAQQFKVFISLKGNEIVDALEESVSGLEKATLINKILDSKFVSDMIDFCEKYLSLLKNELNKDTYFVTAFESAFSSFLNRAVHSHTIAEILARSSERILKKGNQLPSEVEVYHYIENITNLFSYMEDKDLFIEVYQCGLAKRLLDNKCASIDYEKVLIGKIKMNCGPQYTSKVEGMLSDSNAEANIIKEYLDSEDSVKLPIDFDVKVLTDGYWPSFKSPPVVLPKQLNLCVESFNKFYGERNKMKHLAWSYMHGSCLVNSRFEDREYGINLTTYQTSIIMLFNDNEKMTLKEINDCLKTEEGLLRNMLDSLSCKRYKLLSKTGNPKVVSKEDEFYVNDSFKSKLKLISVPAPIVKEIFNKEKVNIDRTHAIDAAIVKIMKSRKKMTYMHLLNEVMVILQMFKPTATIIKSRIESLEERDFLEKDSEDEKVYRYLA